MSALRGTRCLCSLRSATSPPLGVYTEGIQAILAPRQLYTSTRVPHPRSFSTTPSQPFRNKRRAVASTEGVEKDRGFDKRYTTQLDFERSGRARLPQDHEITDPLIIVLENGVEEGPLESRFVLSRVQEHESLRMIRPYVPANPKAEPKPTPVRYAVCKIVDKKEEYDRLKESKEKKKAKVTVKTKALELTWAIDEHDLETKMRRLGKFVEDGHKIEVVVGNKKRGAKKATAEEMEKVVKRIQSEVEEKGGRESKAQSGSVGTTLRLFYEGKKKQ